MEDLWAAGIAAIVWLQALGPALTTPMQLISFLGEVEFYLLLMPALYWCWHANKGLRLGVLLMLSAGLNEALKVAFHQPRPFWISASVQALSPEMSFGLPSGHAQHAVCVWGWLAHQSRRRWAWALALLSVVLISLSRAYLGVHFPQCLLLGAGIGALLLAVFVQWEQPASRWLARRTVTERCGVALLASLALLGLTAVAQGSLRGWTVPAAWAEAVLSKTSEPIEAVAPANAFMAAGVLWGLGAGAAWLDTRGGFSVQGPAMQRLLRYLVGMVIVALLWFGLGSLLPEGDSWLALVLRYVHAGLLGFWVAGAAPLLFRRLRLAERA